MRPKFKIDTLVTFKHGENTATGTIDAVITTKTGFQYRIDDNTEIDEKDVIQAYRPMATRTVKRNAKPRANKSKNTATGETAAVQ